MASVTVEASLAAGTVVVMMEEVWVAGMLAKGAALTATQGVERVEALPVAALLAEATKERGEGVMAMAWMAMVVVVVWALEMATAVDQPVAVT